MKENSEEPPEIEEVTEKVNENKEKNEDESTTTVKEAKKEKKESKKEKKRKNKKNRKGIDEFMEDEQEVAAYEAESGDKLANKSEEKPADDELKGSSLVQELNEVETPVEHISTLKKGEMAAQSDLDALDKVIANTVNAADEEKDTEENDVEVKEKQPKGILMAPNEQNTTKSVTIDEENNVVREFSKHQKIEKGRPPSKVQKDQDEKKVDDQKEEKHTKGGKGKKNKKDKKAGKNEVIEKAVKPQNQAKDSEITSASSAATSEQKENVDENVTKESGNKAAAKTTLDIEALKNSEAVI